MKTSTASVLALALAAGASLGACTLANEASSLAISTICPPNAECSFTATCDAQYIGEVTMDSGAVDHLWLIVQVNNRLTNNADASTGRVNTHDAHITSFQMEYDGGFALASAVWPAPNYHVSAAGAASVSMLVVPPTTFTAAMQPAQPVQVTARVRAKGYYEDGSTFESGEFPVAFTWCNGCVTQACPKAGDVITGTCPPDSLGQVPIVMTCETP